MQRSSMRRDSIVGIRNGLLLAFPLWAGAG